MKTLITISLEIYTDTFFPPEIIKAENFEQWQQKNLDLIPIMIIKKTLKLSKIKNLDGTFSAQCEHLPEEILYCHKSLL
ncbi:hypothetical protein NIES4101_83470 [Calothrix sp. NIES-4101]|nr:hypothetical protein NIES4101_83470 [Calothrix sp. NIES-4101]